MACFLTRRARLTREISTRAQGKKHRAKKMPFLPFLPDLPLKINNKFRVANSFTQLVSNIRPVSMKKLKCKHCPIPGCHSKFLVRLANHLTQVHELSEIERKYWLQFAKLQNTNAIRVCDKEGEPKTIFSINESTHKSVNQL